GGASAGPLRGGGARAQPPARSAGADAVLGPDHRGAAVGARVPGGAAAVHRGVRRPRHRARAAAPRRPAAHLRTLRAPRAAMSSGAPNAASGLAARDPGRIVVATALPAPDDGLVRVSWPRTVWRLALEPAVHPWAAHWTLRRGAPLLAVIAAIALL